MSLEEFFWMTALPFWAGFLILIIIVPVAFIVFWKKLMPVAAKTLYYCARRQVIPLYLCHDSGRGELLQIRERRAEGIVMTNKGTYKILPRYVPIEDTGNPSGNPEGNSELTEMDAEGKAIKTVEKESSKFVKNYGDDWVVRRSLLIGLGLPFFVGYTGKICLLSPEVLALYEAGEMAIETEEGKLFNPQKLKGIAKSEWNRTIQAALQPLLLIDPRKIGKIIYQGFDQSQINALIEDAKESERIGKGKFNMKMILIAIIIMIGAAAAIYFLPQLMGAG